MFNFNKKEINETQYVTSNSLKENNDNFLTDKIKELSDDLIKEQNSHYDSLLKEIHKNLKGTNTFKMK